MITVLDKTSREETELRERDIIPITLETRLPARGNESAFLYHIPGRMDGVNRDIGGIFFPNDEIFFPGNRCLAMITRINQRNRENPRIFTISYHQFRRGEILNVRLSSRGKYGSPLAEVGGYLLFVDKLDLRIGDKVSVAVKVVDHRNVHVEFVDYYRH